MCKIVSFEIVKKLKEKGFPQHITDEVYIVDNYGEEECDIGDRLPIPLVPDYMDDVAAPTISQVLKWLREGKQIYIHISFSPNGWEYMSIKMTNMESCGMCEVFNTYEHAAIAGIEYILDNLI